MNDKYTQQNINAIFKVKKQWTIFLQNLSILVDVNFKFNIFQIIHCIK